MGLIYTEIVLSNPSKQLVIQSRALADTGAIHLCIPKHIAIQLDLEEIEKREVIIADGSRQSVPYVGPIKLTFENRNCFVGALVLGDEILLGAIPMEDLDLVLYPSLRKVIVNPDNPNVAVSKVKSLCSK